MDQNASAGGGGASQESIDTVVRLQLGMMQKAASLRGRQPEVRGQHPKQHGCVRAQFEVLGDIPDRLKVGLFAKPATYTAYIRFSNSREADDDTKPDIHGMAIKLTGVDGRKILDGEAEAKTHDFILVDHPVFFIRTADDYAEFFKDVVQSTPNPPVQFIKRLQDRGLKDDVVVLAAIGEGHRQESPLSARYWGEVPYAFGTDEGTICRYSAIPHDGNLVAQIPDAKRGSHYLREAMALHLTQRGAAARFDFAVQVRTDATPAVIDNPTVAWDMLYERVAVITIPPQTFDTEEKRAFGENLSYTPWHALPEHRPVGQINEVRKAVYLASSTLRHETRRAPRAEPTGNESWS